jgi:hypothetical protein
LLSREKVEDHPDGGSPRKVRSSLLSDLGVAGELLHRLRVSTRLDGDRDGRVAQVVDAFAWVKPLLAVFVPRPFADASDLLARSPGPAQRCYGTRTHEEATLKEFWGSEDQLSVDRVAELAGMTYLATIYARAIVATMAEVLKETPEDATRSILLETADYWLQVGMAFGLNYPGDARRVLAAEEASEDFNPGQDAAEFLELVTP